MEIVGAVLSTVNVVLGPAAGARLPARSEAVPAAIEIPRLPLPVMLLMVTVRVRPVPLTAMRPVGRAGLVQRHVAGGQGAGVEVGVGIGHGVGDRAALGDRAAEGAAMEIVGAVLSTVKVVLGPAAGARLPARSEAVPAAIEIPRLPLPVMLLMVTVRVRPVPLTAIVPLAVPVLFSVMLPAARVLVLKLASA